MHHEHHGDCCQPHEHDEYTGHSHAVELLAQACCVGACNHAEHQQQLDFQAMFETQLMTQRGVIELGETTKEKKVKSKKKAKKRQQLGRLCLARAAY